MQNYKQIIVSKKETVRAAYRRLSFLPTIKVASYYSNEKSYIIFNFDKEADKMVVTQNGKTIYESHGDNLWGDTIKEIKRFMHRNVIDPASKFFMKTEKGAFVDITSQIKAA